MNKLFEFRDSELGEFGLKQFEDSSDLKNYSTQSRSNMFPIGSFASAKDKLDIGCRLHTHLRTKTAAIKGYPSNCCAIFYFDRLTQYLNGDSRRHRDFELGCNWGRSHYKPVNINHKTDNLNKTMFVTVINISENRQRRIFCPVRLQAPDDCFLSVGQSTDVSWGICVEGAWTITNWEIDIPIECGVNEKPELPKQMVKGRTEVVADVADEQRKVYGDGFHLLEPEEALSCLSLSLKTGDDFIGLSIIEPLHQFISSLEMVFCSVELEKRTIEGMHMLYYPFFKGGIVKLSAVFLK